MAFFQLLVSRISSSMRICATIQFRIAKSNRKVITSANWSHFFIIAPVTPSSRFLQVSKVSAKYISCRRLSVMSGNAPMSSSDGGGQIQPLSLRPYQVVVAATRDLGIGKDGKLPWRLPSDLKFFKEPTVSTTDPGKKNAVIMGRKTWESIPQFRPLPGRLNVVLTRSGRFGPSSDENVISCGSISSALKLLAESPFCSSVERVFVIGGGQILREALNAPECEAIHVTEIEANIECDTFIPPVDVSLFPPWYSSPPTSVFWLGVVEELLWFISGSTNAKILQEKGIHIWDGNVSREYLDSLEDMEEGDLGPIYGFQWRHFGARYTKMHANYREQVFDQLLDVIDGIKYRWIILSAWNPSDLTLMALPPCHVFAQLYVTNGELSRQMYQCSADMGLDAPFNIASYALLTCMIAHVCGLVPGDFIHIKGDAHVYKSHVISLQEQL